jgi:hypothetical protein
MIRPRNIASGLVAAGLCAGAMWLWDLRPGFQTDLLNPLRTQGRIGEVVKNDTFRVRIDRYHVGGSVSEQSGTNDAHRTEGVFLYVQLQAMAETEPYTMGHARLETRDGLVYDEGGRVGILTESNETYEPMLWGKGTLLFELPKDQLAGARVVVGVRDLLNQLSAESVIDLGIDDAKAAQLTGPRPLPNIELGD